MTKTVEDLEFINDTLSFYKSLTEHEKSTLIDSMIKQRFLIGHTMQGGSDNCSGLFLLKKGQVRVYIISENGREVTLYHLYDRDVCIFSASCMFQNIAFDLLIEVEKETEAYLIPTKMFKRMSENSIPIQHFMNDLMAARFSDVMWVMEQVLFMSIDKRLALFLIDQIRTEQSDTLILTHEKIANHLGTAREVVTRMLKYFQGEGLLKLHRGSIEILDQKRLEKMI